MTTSRFLALTGVLNQLAGTTDLGSAGAANVWAGSKNLSLLGALNYKNGWRSGGSQPYQDLVGVCNALAGTSGLGAVAALNSLAGT